MFGTVTKLRLRDDVSEDQLKELTRQIESDRPSSGVSVTLLRERDNPRTLWVMGAFESEDAYRRNAESPEQTARFERIRALIDGQPEWHDGDVLAAVHRDAPQAASV